MLKTMEGGCHCGRVRFRVTADLDSVTICNCSKKGILHLIVPPGRFELLSGRDDLTTYRFNTGVAQHTFCKGLRHPSVLRAALRSGQDRRQCALHRDIDLAAIKPRYFDGRHWEVAMQKDVPWR